MLFFAVRYPLNKYLVSSRLLTLTTLPGDFYQLASIESQPFYETPEEHDTSGREGWRIWRRFTTFGELKTNVRYYQYINKCIVN